MKDLCFPSSVVARSRLTFHRVGTHSRTVLGGRKASSIWTLYALSSHRRRNAPKRALQCQRNTSRRPCGGLQERRLMARSRRCTFRIERPPRTRIWPLENAGYEVRTHGRRTVCVSLGAGFVFGESTQHQSVVFGKEQKGIRCHEPLQHNRERLAD